VLVAATLVLTSIEFGDEAVQTMNANIFADWYLY